MSNNPYLDSSGNALGAVSFYIMGSSIAFPSTDSGTLMPIESVEESISSLKGTRSILHRPIWPRRGPRSLSAVFDERVGARAKGTARLAWQRRPGERHEQR